MASGSPVVEVIQAIPPATSFATFDVRVGGATPAENMQVWDFDPDADEFMDFLCRLSEDYDEYLSSFVVCVQSVYVDRSRTILAGYGATCE